MRPKNITLVYSQRTAFVLPAERGRRDRSSRPIEFVESQPIVIGRALG